MKNKYLVVLAIALTAGSNALAQSVETTVTGSYNGYPVTILPDYYDVISVTFISVPRALKIAKATPKGLAADSDRVVE